LVYLIVQREGHIIYSGINWKSIIANPSINVIGADVVSTIILLPKDIYTTPNEKYIQKCFKRTLQEFLDKVVIDKNRINNYNKNSIRHKSLIWNLRYIENCLTFERIFQDIDKVTKTHDLCGIIIEKVTGKPEPSIRRCLKENILFLNNDHLIPFKLRTIGIILSCLHNYINEYKMGLKYSSLIVESFSAIKSFLYKLDKTF
jgi:hypothetical protein